jgi:pimeloyl-ACP methyl ester carboxylesterase
MKSMRDIGNTTTTSVHVLSDAGSGRSFVTMVDDDRYAELIASVSSRIAQRARSVVLKTSPVLAENWRILAKDMADRLSALGIRQASFIGVGSCAALAEDLALSAPKAVRSLVVIDSPLRPHPTRWERIVDALECRLPFGLPLRLGLRGFNVRSYAHRLRCPVLTVATPRASHFVASELAALGALAPTSWHLSLRGVSANDEARELGDIVVEFQDTPAKCPQKNRQEAL